MEPTALPLEDILDGASASSPLLTLWLAGHTLSSARFVSWNRASGILVCRGGGGFTDEDFHYIRLQAIQGITVRLPASRPETDRISPALREALRAAAGYPVSLVLRPDTFLLHPDALAEWLQNIIEAVTHLEPFREAFQSQIDQILLREGSAVAVLGGSSLILEALPQRIPTPETLRGAISTLL